MQTIHDSLNNPIFDPPAGRSLTLIDSSPTERLEEECAKVLKKSATEFPSQRQAILDSIEDMAESWARTLHAEGVQWQSVAVLYADARTSLRAAGRTSFPPNVEDLIRAHDNHEARTYRGKQQTHWQEHDKTAKGAEYPTTIPVVAQMFRKREAPVVCHCKYRDGVDMAARIALAGDVWECGNIGNPGCCDFILSVDATLTAPLPAKSYYGTTKRAEEAPQRIQPAAPRVEVPTTDEMLITSLEQRCEIAIEDDKKDYWLAFARFLIEKGLPIETWSRLIASAMYPKWTKTLVPA